MPIKTEQLRKKIEQESFNRTATFKREAVDEETRTIEIAFSSEDPYMRWYGYEILGHGDGDVDMEFMASGSAPFLAQHDHDNVIGIIERAWIDSDSKGRAVVRFSKSARAEEFFQDVIDGIRKNISVGYEITEAKLVEESEDGPDTYRMKWRPLEASLVSVPADTTVGVGRAHKKSNPDSKEKNMGYDTDKTTPDVETVMAQAAKEAREAEVLRIGEINALGKVHGFEDDASKAVNDGRTVDQFRAFVLDELKKRAAEPIENFSPEIGMTEKEVKQFSFLKLIRALADPNQAKHAGFELECSRAFEDLTGRTAKGAFVPHDVLSAGNFLHRDLSTNVGTAGGYLVSEDMQTESFIDMLRNAAAVMRLGTRTLTGLIGDIDIPKQTGGASAYWVNEGGDLTESQQTLGQIRMSPKTIGCYTDVTRRMMLQSSMDVETFIRQDFALQMGIAIDLGALNGDAASGEPRGLLNTTGIGSVTLNGTNTPDWGDIVDLETAISTDNALFGSLAYLTNATIVGKMKQTEKASSTGKFIYENGELNGYNCEISNNVPAKYLLFGNWADMIIGMWSGLDVTVDTNSLSTSGGTRIVCFQDIDVAIRHAESFAAGYKS